jgi:hypothetical protein
VIVELRLEQFIKASLALYKQQPLLTESVFFDAAQVGVPAILAPGVMVDLTKRWLPGEYAGGTWRYGDSTLPILGNDATLLTLDGDPSSLTDPEGDGYQIIPPDARQLQELLETRAITVTTSFAQVPAEMTCFVIRLERDSQGPAFVGESLESRILEGREVATNRATMTGQYLISIYSTNRLETLWLYAWLHNACLRSMQQFASWGLFDVSLSGSDLDPVLGFLPERPYARHLLFEATRDERAVSTQDVAYISEFCTEVLARYARLDARIPYPMGV